MNPPRDRAGRNFLSLLFGLTLAQAVYTGEPNDPRLNPTPPLSGPGQVRSEPSRSVVQRLACSTLCQAKQSTEKAFQTIAKLGYRWIDLSCLNWAPHVSVPRLVEDFEAETTRLEALLAANGLRVSNLTFDAVESRPFNRYRQEFTAVVRLAVRLKARLINLMAPSLKADRQDQVHKLRKLQAIAQRAGVRLTLETHVGQITEKPAGALWICRQVPGLGLTLDPSHYYAGPHQGGDFNELLPYVQGTGFRAGGMSWSEIQLPWGQGPINFTAIARNLESAGYQGFYVAEYIEGFNQVDAVKESRRFLAWGTHLHLKASSPPVILENNFLRFRLFAENGRYDILDKQTGVTWRSHPEEDRFGEVVLEAEGQRHRANLDRCRIQRRRDGLEAAFHPWPEKPGVAVRVQVNLVADGRALEFAYDPGSTATVREIRLLDHALWVTDKEKGYAVVPVREGLLVPADSGQAFTHRFDTYGYEGCHLAMLGLSKRHATALLTWRDPYVSAELKSAFIKSSDKTDRQRLEPSLILRRSARSFRIRFLGQGDYVGIAKAYRQAAKEKGLLVTWKEKLKGHRERARLFGAIDFKLWSLLTRRMDEASSREQSVRVNWTFEEAAQVAEHLKRDLQLDRVLFLMGGWIRRGYDNQHPDILPAAPECGGNDALADCARRVRALGYLFGLHDNYQDMYRDAPSWDERFLMKSAKHGLARGGRWAGGRAYLICSREAVELARRPHNLPAVKALTHASAYFIDTTFAAGLQECFDPSHPLTRIDDMRWKQALADYARGLFGIFGSEGGREWAIPHSDFFEGLIGVSGRYYHNPELMRKLGAVSIPLFELVYRDCIALYGKYGYDPALAARYVLYHIGIGRPLHYHNIPAHLYWKKPVENRAKNPTSDLAVFTRADNGWAAGLHPLDRFVKNTYEILSPLNELTAQMPMTAHEFLTADYEVQRSVFGEGPQAVEVVVNAGKRAYQTALPTSGEIVLPPYGFLVASPCFVAFNALKWGGLDYEKPVLFTLRSLDGRPLQQSGRIRIFHGFGDARIRLGQTTYTVPRERVLEKTESPPRGTAREP